MKDILAIVFSAAVAALAEFVNFLITRRALSKQNGVSAVFALRTVIVGAVLAGIYFAAKALTLDVTACMIAAAVAAGVSLAVFTAFLMRSDKKGGGKDG